jgi:hypothetical protein
MLMFLNYRREAEASLSPPVALCGPMRATAGRCLPSHLRSSEEKVVSPFGIDNAGRCGRSRRPSGRLSPASHKARWGRSPLCSNQQRITRASQVPAVFAKAWVSEPDAPPHPQSGPDNGAGPPPFLSCPEGYHKSLPDGATTGFVNLSLFSHWRELR